MKIRIAGALVFAMLATLAYAQKVDVDADPSAPFASYRTYAWAQGTPSPTALGERRFHFAVDAQLAAKGLTEVGTAPDVFAATHVIPQERSYLIASGFGWGRGAAAASIQRYGAGTLVVDLYDAKTRQLVWRGVGAGLGSDTVDRNNIAFHQALNRMFEKYPSGSSQVAAR
jgi:hypothetical protein